MVKLSVFQTEECGFKSHHPYKTHLVEMVDTVDLKSTFARNTGSIPVVSI